LRHYRLVVTCSEGRTWREIAFYEPRAQRTELVGSCAPPSPWDDQLLELPDSADQADAQLTGVARATTA
jgi:hypothetical protein